MPRKTDGEKIDELEKNVAVVIERLDTLRDEVDAQDDEVTSTKDKLADLTILVKLLERDFGEFKQRSDVAGQRRWSLIPPIVGGIVGAGLTLLVHFLLSLLR